MDEITRDTTLVVPQEHEDELHPQTLHVLLDKLDTLEYEAKMREQRITEAFDLITKLSLRCYQYDKRIKRLEGRRSLSVKLPNKRVRP